MEMLLGLFFAFCLLGLVIGLAKRLVKLAIFAAILLLIFLAATGGLSWLIGG